MSPTGDIMLEPWEKETGFRLVLIKNKVKELNHENFLLVSYATDRYSWNHYKLISVHICSTENVFYPFLVFSDNFYIDIPLRSLFIRFSLLKSHV